MSRVTMQIWLFDDDTDEEIPYTIPAVWEICDRCGGVGRHVNPNIDGNGITQEEWDRDWDDEQKEFYMQGGYDVDCHDCGGPGKVLVPDWDRVAPDIAKRYEAKLDDEAASRREAAYWRRLESGGRE